MTDLDASIARDLQRKLSDDVFDAAARVLSLAPSPQAMLPMSVQGVCSLLNLTAEIIEHDMGNNSHSRHLSIYFAALMAARTYEAGLSDAETISSAEVMRGARDDMERLGLFSLKRRKA